MLKYLVFIWIIGFYISTCHSQTPSSDSDNPDPPVAKKEPKLKVFHGDTLIDNYYWMRHKNDRELINYLSAENGYTGKMMKDSREFQKQLYQEMKERLEPDNSGIPQKLGNYLYFTRMETGKNYPVYFRKKDNRSSEEEVLLDMNQVSEKSPFTRLLQFAVSPDQNFLAYSVDFTGSGKGSIYIKNLKTGDEISDEIHHTGQVLWGHDNQTIYYTFIDSTNRGHKVLRHKIGASPNTDLLVYEERDSTYSVSLYTSVSKEYLFMISASTIATECRYLKLSDRQAQWVLIKPRVEGIRYIPQHYESQDVFMVYYNDTHQAPFYNGSVKTLLIKEKNALWQGYLPANHNYQVENYAFFKDYIVVLIREMGLQKFKVIPKVNNLPDTTRAYLINFQDETYSLAIGSNTTYNSQKFRYRFTSFTEPNTTYEYDLATREHKVLARQKVVGYKASDYMSERIRATATDGTLIPVSLVYRKGLVKDGTNPLYLNGYGAFGISSDPFFNPERLSLLDRGVIYAIAHVRGGGEMGYQWHVKGRRLNKMNTFTDFFSVAEYLIKEGYTSQNRLICQGASSGGLLAGAAAVMRPDLFKGIIINVPFLDVINTQSDPTIPLSAIESYEWGDPHLPEVYKYMKSYSPYDNIKARDYPNILVQGGFNDENVAFWEAPKFVAKMRSLKTDHNLLLLKMSMNGGHGLTSGRYGGLRQKAFEYAFIFKTLGIKSSYSRISGKVTDENGEFMPYVNIVLKNTTKGTTTNSKGEYALELKNGSYTFVFRHVGFEQEERTIQLSGDVSLDVSLKTESMLLKAVEITGSHEDPAYAIIKSAIETRKTYLNQVEGYSARVYIRTDNRFDEIPEKRPFFIPKNDMPDSSDLGLVYLSESEALLYKKKPGLVKELMVSSRVAGNSQGYSWNRAGDLEFNFYKNRVRIGGLNERGFVSPIADNALFFYRYEYIGLKEQTDDLGNKVLINKIKVIPRRKNDPVFGGYIYIAEDSWRIAALDLSLKNHQIEIFDDFKLEQNYIAVTDSVWMPLSVKFYAHLSIFGFGISGSNIISYSSYQLNLDFPKKFFNNEIFKIEKDANLRDTTYWFTNRPIALSDDEISYYRKKDKIEMKKKSRVYLDSLDRARNKTSWQDIFNGFWYYKRYTKERFSTNALPDMVNFNTVEGLSLNFQFRYQKGESRKRHFKWVNTFRYGFSNKRFNTKTSLFWTLDPQKHQSIQFEGGRFVNQFNNNNPIYPVVNTFYSLVLRENYMKLYGTNFGRFSYKHEFSNGIYLSGKLTYEDRMPLTNTNNYSFRRENTETGVVYTSNDPLEPDNTGPSFTRHQALVFDAELKILINQRFITRPDRKIPMGSKYPKFTIHYRYGSPVLFSDVNYHFAAVNVGDNIDLGLLGKLSYDVKVGNFFGVRSMKFIDYQHFNGNQTLFINYTAPFGMNRTPLDRFQLLDYYAFSTNAGFLEGHLEFHGNGFIMNKIPLLRKTKFQAVGGINVLLTEGKNEHVELSAGLENILKAFRVDFVTGYNQEERLKSAIRFRLGLNGL
ncbi:MAG: DUF5686 family protein [Cytophagales bacterium]|nr:DUF5686 family protein [Cytophagales bacterium]